MPRKIAAGNWKMNGTAASITEMTALTAAHPAPTVSILICPPSTLLAQMNRASKGHPLALGGQDCHTATHGAHTGDIAAAMLADAGATYVLAGHSERRTDHGETNATVAAKSAAAHAAGLIAVVCIGETLTEREAGTTLNIIGTQLTGSLPAAAHAGNTVIAYEPVWAIGTGKVPTIDQIAEVHAHIRNTLPAAMQDASILYGGSVKASNASEIFATADVDGALVGGASLKATDFSPIITALENA